jgi:hypothetical protein
MESWARGMAWESGLHKVDRVKERSSADYADYADDRPALLHHHPNIRNRRALCH